MTLPMNYCNGVKFGVEASPNFTIHRRNVLPLRSENSQRYPSSNLNTGVCAKRIKLIMKRPFCRSTDDNDNGRVNQSNLYKRDHTALFFCGAGMFSKVSLSRMPGTVLYQWSDIIHRSIRVRVAQPLDWSIYKVQQTEEIPIVPWRILKTLELPFINSVRLQEWPKCTLAVLMQREMKMQCTNF